MYHATSKEGDMAIKIYKTSILVFKDRERYVAGEFRWKNGYCKSNPRKMVKVWAEKEYRNLRRLNQAGIRSPIPVMLRSHVLVMKYIGKNSHAAPRLKDAQLKTEQYEESYLELVKIMRRMFQECKLVHGDLSEYNLLYYKGHLWVIDVSQSVEHDHPQALDFLRRDCANVNDYYRKMGLAVMSTRELFEFITSTAIKPGEEEEYLLRLQETLATRVVDESAEEVFMQAYIPRSMDEVPQHVYERIHDDIEDGHVNTDSMYAAKMISDREAVESAQEAMEEEESATQDADQQDVEDAEEEVEEGEEEEYDEEDPSKHLDRSQFTKEEWKEKKKEIKAARQQQISEKVPKHVKKRFKKKASNNSKRGKT